MIRRRNRKFRELVIKETHILVPLTQGKHSIIDHCDKYKVYGKNWNARKDCKRDAFYAIRGVVSENGDARTVLMHREILQAPDGMCVDHKNFDTLDNRRSNLRLVTNKQNLQHKKLYKNNSSGYKGVGFHKIVKRWSSAIRFNGSAMFLGYFDTPQEAAIAYDEAAKHYNGEFASLNFPDRTTE